MIAAAGEFVVTPGWGLLIWTLFVFAVAIPSAAVAGLKGRWGWFLCGFVTGGLAWVVGAFLSPLPGSRWWRRRQAH